MNTTTQFPRGVGRRGCSARRLVSRVQARLASRGADPGRAPTTQPPLAPPNGRPYNPVVTLNGWTLPWRMKNGWKEFHPSPSRWSASSRPA